MSGKCRPSLRAKTLLSVARSNLSTTDKKCIHAVFERFIPKKPTPLVNVYPSGQYECPNCEFGLRASKEWQDKYCCNCGQAIDWSDDDDR